MTGYQLVIPTSNLTFWVERVLYLLTILIMILYSRPATALPVRVRKYLALFFLAGVGGLASSGANAASLNSDALKGIFAANYSSSDFTYFPKWTRTISSLKPDALLKSASCDDGNEYHCNIQRWKDTLDTLKGKSVEEKLKGVNGFVNSFPYVQDQNNWGTDDYWETPAEFFSRNGDCEDFAIMKYVSLLKLGVPASSMRIVILNDANLNVLHAVLAVKSGSSTMILDNQMNQVVSANAIHHYQPIFSINQEGWWRHQIMSSSVM